jgi:NAD(P)-dependent dehydrogenase (short-subunit alcohol dehydrogenase family)
MQALPPVSNKMFSLRKSIYLKKKNKHLIINSTREEYARVFDTNVGSVSDVTQTFLPLLRQSSGKKIVNISSIMASMDASIKEDPTGMVSPYRVSKGALNVLMSIFASALAAESFTVVSLHPGWVRTSMGGENGQLDPPESVRYQIETIGKLTTADNGRFVSYDGKAIPW